MINPKVIFWDWNGTLLDDVDICIDSMNAMLSKRNMKTIDLDYYTEVFGFPVVEYYKKLGFSFEFDSFENLSEEFIAEYNSRVGSVKLHGSVLEILNSFKRQNIKQVIVSAMEHKMLLKLLEKHNIYNYFDDVRGLSNIYAGGKVHLAQEYIAEKNLNPENILLIGDTLHDAEVAREIGANLILVSHGHHNYRRLALYGEKVINSLDELTTILN